MYKIRFALRVITLLTFVCAFAAVANAQATRTWVSGVGDDVNPCSRTAPCKTYAGAISKTATGGEISVLDPGGYGTLTITKAITVDGGTGAGWGSTLASSVSGFTVNVSTNPTTATVTLRNVTVNGIRDCVTAGCQGLSGIRFLAGHQLVVENATIYGMNTHGIDVAHNVAAGQTARLLVRDTTISNIGQAGVRIAAASGGTFTAALENVGIHKASIGVDSLNTSQVMVSNSSITGVVNQAVVAENTSQINVENCTLAHNGTAISAFSSGSTVRISGNRIYNNGTSIAIAAGGTVNSRGDNRVAANGAGVLPNGTAIPAL